MIITGGNLDLFYKHRDYFQKYKEITDEKIGYNLEAGQQINSITYNVDVNKFLKYGCTIKKISQEGICFVSWLDENKEIFYPWENENSQLVIRPCEFLYEKYPIKKLVRGEIRDNQVWYKHGGFRSCSKYENNLSNFIVLGQQGIF